VDSPILLKERVRERLERSVDLRADEQQWKAEAFLYISFKKTSGINPDATEFLF
jgi:hypothetical protein